MEKIMIYMKNETVITGDLVIIRDGFINITITKVTLAQFSPTHHAVFMDKKLKRFGESMIPVSNIQSIHYIKPKVEDAN